MSPEDFCKRLNQLVAGVEPDSRDPVGDRDCWTFTEQGMRVVFTYKFDDETAEWLPHLSALIIDGEVMIAYGDGSYAQWGKSIPSAAMRVRAALMLPDV